MTRITNSMLVKNYMTNTNRNLNNMQILQNQLSSGKEITRPSDNPYKASRAMQLYTEIHANKQYNENIKDVSNWLDITDTALNQINNVLSRIRELMVTSGNGAYGADEKKAIQDEIKELQNQICQIMNTNFDGAYIFGGTKSTSKPVMIDENGNIAYANKDGKPINIYLNSAGEVVNSAVTNNAQLGKDDKLYLDENGNITTSSKSEDGKNNTSIISSGSLYIDSNGKITTNSQGNKSIALVDNLYVDAKNNITTDAITENKLMDTSNILYYVTPDGYVTTEARSEGSSVDNERITTDDPIYVTSDGKVKAKTNTVDTITSSDKLINWGDALYENLNGDIVINKETVNQKIDLDEELYVDRYGNITNELTYKNEDGTLGQNNYLDANVELYVDSNGTITINSDGNKMIALAETLYLDDQGDARVLKYQETMPVDGEKISSGTKLYIDENGNITSKDGVEKDAEGNIIKENISMILSDKLYLDKDNNITLSPTTPNLLVKTDEALYVDVDGNVSTAKTGNLLSSDVALYRDAQGNVTTKDSTNGVANTLLNRGDSLYSDKNGNVVVSETSNNDEIPTDKKIYVDAKNNLTFNEKVENKPLTLDDVKKLKDEFNNAGTTEERKNEISKILKNDDVAQLLQIDSDLKVEVSQGVFIDYNISASDILEFTDSKTGEKISVVEILNDIISNLGQDGDVSKITGESINKMDSIISNLLEKRSKVGAMTNRMESAEEKNNQENLNMTDILSKTEDIDFTEKMMEYAVMQTVYMASLQVSAKILPTTLMDYLR